MTENSVTVWVNTTGSVELNAIQTQGKQIPCRIFVECAHFQTQFCAQRRLRQSQLTQLEAGEGIRINRRVKPQRRAFALDQRDGKLPSFRYQRVGVLRFWGPCHSNDCADCINGRCRTVAVCAFHINCHLLRRSVLKALTGRTKSQSFPIEICPHEQKRFPFFLGILAERFLTRQANHGQRAVEIFVSRYDSISFISAHANGDEHRSLIAIGFQYAGTPAVAFDFRALADNQVCSLLGHVATVWVGKELPQAKDIGSIGHGSQREDQRNHRSDGQ